MSCKKCNKKDELKQIGDFTPKSVYVIFVVWLFLGLYGLYELINKFI